MAKKVIKKPSRFTLKTRSHQRYYTCLEQYRSTISDGESPFIATELKPPKPYKFVFSIEAIPELRINSVSVDTTSAEDFDTADGKFVFKLSAIVRSSKFILTIDAVGDVGSEADFTVTCDGKKVYGETQTLAFVKPRRLFIDPNARIPK